MEKQKKMHLDFFTTARPATKDMYPSVKFSDKEIQTTYYVLKAGDDAERKGRCPPARGCSVIKKKT